MLVWFRKGLLDGVAKVGGAFQRRAEIRMSHSDYPRQLYNHTEHVILANNIVSDVDAVALEQCGIDFIKSRDLSTNVNDAALSRKDNEEGYSALDPGCVYYIPLLPRISLSDYFLRFSSYYTQSQTAQGFVGARALGVDKFTLGLDKYTLGLDKFTQKEDKYTQGTDVYSMGILKENRGVKVGSVNKNNSLTDDESQLLHELFAKKFPQSKAGYCTCTRRLSHGSFCVHHKNGASYTYARLQCFGCKLGFKVPLKKFQK